MKTTITSLPVQKAIIINVDPFYLEKKLKDIQATNIASFVSSVQRFDITKGYHFIQPIYVSSRFKQLFDDLAHHTISGRSFIEQSIYLIIKRIETKNEVSLLIPGKKTLRIEMSLDQTKSMIKVLRAGGMKKISLFKKDDEVYQHPVMDLKYRIHTLSHLPSILEVESEKEEYVLDGLADVDLAINRAILNMPFERVLKKYLQKPSCDLLKFLM